MPDLEQLGLPDLLRNPREALDIEIKEWLELADPNQRAALAKAIIALANHGGGYLIIGLADEGTGQFVPAQRCPTDLTGLSQDAVQDAVQKYVEPTIQCRTEHVTHSETGMLFPIVVVPGGHRVPIRASSGSPDSKLVKDRVYIRRPGPRSEEPKTSAEWDQLFERCLLARKEELLTGIRDLLAGEVPRVAMHQPALQERLGAFVQRGQQRWHELTKDLPVDSAPRFPNGFYDAGFAIDGGFDVPSLPALREILRHSLRNHSGWPPFLIIDRDSYRPRPVDGAIETWLGPDADGSVDVPSRCDFWWIKPEGFSYTRRGFDEDGRLKNVEPGTALNINTPIWRIGELILQVHYVAMALEATEANLFACFRWHGLSGRHLISTRSMSMVRTARQDEYKTNATMAVSTIPTALPEIVFGILSPLYQLFDFFQLSKRLVTDQLAEMMSHRFYE